MPFWRIVQTLNEDIRAVTIRYPSAGSSPLPTTQQGYSVFWSHGDHLGSASLVTSITGTVVNEMRYTPLGEVRWSNGNTPTDRTFTGQKVENAGSVGSLMDYGGRFYSPMLGRFISADSIVPQPGDPQSLNRYSYVRNSPLNFVDPTGHSVDCAGGDSACSTNEWMWKNRWYEAHGHFWDGKGWSNPGDARFADMGIARQTLGEAGISILGEWRLKELSLATQGVVALANMVGGLAKLQTLLGGATFFVRYYLDLHINILGNDILREVPAMVGYGQVSDALNNTVEFFDGIFGNSADYARGETVHELGHVIDYHSSVLYKRGADYGSGRLSEAIPDRMTNDISNYGMHGATGQAIAEYFGEAVADWVYGKRYFGPYAPQNNRNALTTQQAQFMHDYLVH